MADDDNRKPRVRSRRRPPQTGGRPAAVSSEKTENTHADPDYEVGYGKPPKATQFKKGQSGNPKGRPALARNYRSIVNQELNTPRSVRRDGQELKVPTRHILVLKLFEKALNGDLKAMSILLALDDEAQEAAREIFEAEAGRTITSEEDQAILDAFVEMVTSKGGKRPTGNTADLNEGKPDK